MIHKKAQLIRQLGLGGGMIWALDLDDFKDHCNEGAHPLLTELQSVLANRISESNQQTEVIVNEPTTVGPSQNGDAEIIEEVISHEDSSISIETSSSSSDGIDYKVVCYFSKSIK